MHLVYAPSQLIVQYMVCIECTNDYRWINHRKKRIENKRVWYSSNYLFSLSFNAPTLSFKENHVHLERKEGLYA